MALSLLLYLLNEEGRCHINHMCCLPYAPPRVNTSARSSRVCTPVGGSSQETDGPPLEQQDEASLAGRWLLESFCVSGVRTELRNVGAAGRTAARSVRAQRINRPPSRHAQAEKHLWGFFASKPAGWIFLERAKKMQNKMKKKADDVAATKLSYNCV